MDRATTSLGESAIICFQEGLYATLVNTTDASYAITCNVGVDDEFSEPCRRVFGGASSGRWHR